MTMIRVEDLSFSYDNGFEKIFDHVSFVLDSDWKLGLIGRNGRGKTTLLKLLMGYYEYQGKIISPMKFDYFPYVIDEPYRLVQQIFSELCPEAQDWELVKELSYLNMNKDVLWQSYELLSQGEQLKVLLAMLFLHKDRFLLIDEPTNHLDSQGRDVVARYLQRKKGFILVSHDRYFLDRCIDHVMALNKNSIDIQKGNFSLWYERYQTNQSRETQKNEQLKKEIKGLKEAAKRTSLWSDKVEASKKGALDKGYVGHKAAKMMKRSKSLEMRQQKAIQVKAQLLKNTETADDLKISPLQGRGTLVTLDHVSIFYDHKRVCHNVSFTVGAHERIVLSGKNGCGKSSLLKLLLHENICYEGSLYYDRGLIISYVSQDIRGLKGNLKRFVRERKIDESLFKSILRKMGFERTDFEKHLEDFSDGQKKKVLIACSLCQRAHLYIWDEPLNYIDIFSRIQIEELIRKFLPTMIVVEHDRMFCERIATKVICLDENYIDKK
ncbi:ABC-F type ribosomal protection protein [[Clostridium] spiroforme]|nr:ABC-F type ribosomal protection protein [Thomasclavelia spiroformis]